MGVVTVFWKAHSQLANNTAAMTNESDLRSVWKHVVVVVVVFVAFAASFFFPLLEEEEEVGDDVDLNSGVDDDSTSVSDS